MPEPERRLRCVAARTGPGGPGATAAGLRQAREHGKPVPIENLEEVMSIRYPEKDAEYVRIRDLK